MLARLRSLMRARDAAHELDLRDETARALGFAEPSARFNHGARLAIVAVISNHYDNNKKIMALLENNAAYKLIHIAPEHLMANSDKLSQPDVYIINLSSLDH